MTEIIRHSLIGNQDSVFILNVYSSAKDLKQRFKSLLTKAAKLARDSPLIVAGDFNAPCHVWGYPYNTNKGESLWREATDLELTLITDPAFPTT